jgi:iron complex outermembrane receptor protein
MECANDHDQSGARVKWPGSNTGPINRFFQFISPAFLGGIFKGTSRFMPLPRVAPVPFLLFAFLGVVPLFGQVTESDWPDLAELGKIEVTIATRRATPLNQTAAAVAVVTREDIRASGATSIPEALRMVPGLNIAQINSNTWAIGARGFQWQYANKLLVMIDGRPVYSPTSGGVRWQDNTTFLDDIGRIEVVRGPGSSVWGANAVNGVINIVTLSAFDTLGTHGFAAAGDELPGSVGLRQGVKLSDTAAIRVYGQYRETGENVLPAGGDAGDGSHMGQGGFRLDWKPSPADTITFQGDVYAQSTGYVRSLTSLSAAPTYTTVYDSPVRSRGANLLGRWHHVVSDDTYVDGQTYWNHGKNDRPQERETLDTWDAELTAGTRVGTRQDFTAGLGYRITEGSLRAGVFTFSPDSVRTHLFSVFAQDQITLVPDRWVATVGSRLEHNSFTGWELQPTVRLTFTPSSEWVFWSSIARAVRTPTWIEEISAFDASVSPGVIDPGVPSIVRLFGDRQLKSEKLLAFELGTRWQLSEHLSVDVAVFSYDYDDYVLVAGTGVTRQLSPAAQVFNTQFQNGIKGESYGGEFAVRWSPAEWWQLFGSYSYVNVQLHTTQSDPFGFEQDENTTPRSTTRVESSMRLGRHWELNLTGRYVEPVPYYGVPSYGEMDARLAWKPVDHWQLSLVGRNLLHDQHVEYDSALSRRLTAIQRAVYLIVRTDF